MNYSRKDINNIKGALRQAYHMSDHYRTFLQSHRIEIPKYKKNGDRAKRDIIRYKCEECLELYSGLDVHVDHIEPIQAMGRLEIDTVGELVSRLYCSYDNLQLLCTSCHDEKTSAEREYFKLVF